MMIYPEMYKVEGDKCIYIPVAGPTIKEAIANAIEISCIEKKPVELHINDIVLDVNQKSDPSKIALKYFTKLERKYRQPYNAVYHQGLGLKR